MTDTRRAAHAACPTARSCLPSGLAITDLVIERGEGSWLITTDGERYLDYSAASA